MWFLVLIGVGLAILIKLCKRNKPEPPVSLVGLHVIVTGGSSGIGKSVAKQLAQAGANVTVFARDQDKLDAAKSEIISACKTTEPTVNCVSLDISKDYSQVEQAVKNAVGVLGPVSILVNCAGYATTAIFEDLPLEEFRKLMDVNYFGSVYVTKACVPYMKEKGGHVVLTSSQAGLIGLYGFTGYSAAKFALRGLAEALAMELKPFNIFVTLSCPPDTDTPGFAEEEKNKPQITREISQSSGLLSPDVVAKGLINDMLQRKFLSSVGFEGAIITAVCSGMSPVSSLTELLVQIHVMGPLRLVSYFFLRSFDSIVQRGLVAGKKAT